jgi:hypothetical protein
MGRRDDAARAGHVVARRTGRPLAAARRRSSHSSQTVRSGAALKIDEYVPDVIPMSRARMKVWIDDPAKSSSAVSVNTTVRLVLIERASVWRIEWLTIEEKFSPAWRARFSRIR